ncbi:DUF4179 domain-containing protein [uncultured Oscillibacter sp.]|uniref:DUF4179 domain-containing protein n=1 Tax=uncultured Oscillibacter sp. TaxID=876091 RepID=UPI00272B508A|nr:DUF4179 domain-containing protein [uncultured Oscillibacter sp.]
MSDLFDYKKEMSELRFTEIQKKALAEAAASAARTPAKRRRPVFRTALIAAAMAAVLVVGSSAAGILPSPAEIFTPLFGGAAAQTEVIDKIGRPIGASDTDNGITITAEAIMGDQYNAVIVYTLTRDDGERFLPEGKSLDETHLMIDGFNGASWVKGGAHGGSWFVDEDPEDNQIQLVETASSNVAMTKGTANASFEDLQYWNAETEQAELLYPGKWKLRFEVDYEDCSVRLGGGETFSQDGLNFTIDEITLSPIAVRVVYTADSAVVWSDAPSGREAPENAPRRQRYLENIEILLTKTDGTVIDLGGSGGRVSPDYKADVSHCTKGQVFDEIIPLEEMESIRVGGVTYEIPHS